MFAPKESACLHKILSDSFHLNKEVGGPAGLGNMKIGALLGCKLMAALCLSLSVSRDLNFQMRITD